MVIESKTQSRAIQADRGGGGMEYSGEIGSLLSLSRPTGEVGRLQILPMERRRGAQEFNVQGKSRGVGVEVELLT